jgi:hypothetical protein
MAIRPVNKEIFMKSVESQFTEAATAAKKAGLDLTPFLTEGNIEQRFNKLKVAMAEKKITIKESRPARITRNNGQGGPSGKPAISETDERALTYVKQTGCSFREAYLLTSNFKIDLKDGKLPAEVVEAIAAEWRAYSKAISETDARSLAIRGVRPE